MWRTAWRIIFWGAVLCTLAAGYYFRWDVIGSIELMKDGDYTIDQRVEQYGGEVRKRLKPYFKTQRVCYPPEKMILVAIKKEARLELYASDSTTPMRHIRDYPILAASGKLGPKLREGDRQVPEGVYPIELLNPNSLYHLSLRIGYPNAFDRAQGVIDGRNRLGGDIMIHGRDVSIGCLAMGDEAAEDLFVLGAKVGVENIKIILTPVDFRKETATAASLGLAPWIESVYAEIRQELAPLKP